MFISSQSFSDSTHCCYCRFCCNVDCLYFICSLSKYANNKENSVWIVRKKRQINYGVHSMSHNCLHYAQLQIKVAFFMAVIYRPSLRTNSAWQMESLMQQLLCLTFAAFHNQKQLCGFEEVSSNSIGMQGQSPPSNHLSDIKHVGIQTHTHTHGHSISV